MKPSPLHHNSGMTLAEILVTVSIVSVIALVVSKFQSDVFSYNRFFESSFSTADKAQKLLRPMTQEIRSASSSNNGSYPIENATATDFSFYSDIDNDGLKDLVRYYISGTSIIKEVTEPTGTPLTYLPASKVTTTFMTGVRNTAAGIPMFTYYDGTYTGGNTGVITPSSATIASIRMVGVAIRLDEDVNKPPAPIDIVSQVSIRNLKQQQ